MTPGEQRATFALAGIYALRMLGLFLIFPVFALYAEHLAGATPLLVGVAVGAYGLTQALLQIPFGMVSDRLGRKPVIVFGLLVFALGSSIAAIGTDVWTVIAGRALQGAGAVAGVVMALLADLTRESQRTKAMATIGMTIGLSFAVALMAGPLLNELWGVPGIFWLVGGFALAGIGLVHWVVPTPRRSVVHRDAEVVGGQLGVVLRNRELLRLDFGIFALHAVMTSLFLAVPLQLRDVAGLAAVDHWRVYLPALVLAVATMIPFIVLAERRGRMKGVFLGAIATVLAAQLGLNGFDGSALAIGGWVWLFFVGFNLLEATLPSLVSKIAPAAAKGTAMGIYATSQFAGAFLGGVGGGLAHQHYGLGGVFTFGVVVCAAWLAVASGMARPRPLSRRVLAVGSVGEDEAAALAARFLAVPGVAEAVVVAEEGVAYLKVNEAQLDEGALGALAPAAA
jgi:predicted MFS family arabinose efflux permease